MADLHAWLEATLRRSSGRSNLAKAIRYTLVGTAELYGWDPQAYLRLLLDRIADHPFNRIGEFAPWNARPETA
jgi:hypothetical protein